MNISELKGNIDSWIKSINERLSYLEADQEETKEMNDDIQHNYVLIYELTDKIEELKSEINAMKLIHITLLKKTKP